MDSHSIPKPLRRSRIRRFLGREYFIAKRRFQWLLTNKKYAVIEKHTTLEFSVIKHHSTLLRPLKDVEMYLQHNKVQNLALALRHINGVVINPGEYFSVWKMVGRPLSYKGYQEGVVLENGTVSKGIGGGLCQLGNLLYWMALHTPLRVTERWRHSYDVFPDTNRTLPFGCGATLSYNYIDLQLHNNTSQRFQIQLWTDAEFLHGEILSDSPLAERYEVFETDHCFLQQWWGGYTRHNRLWKRITSLSDHSQRDELVTANDAIVMYTPLLGS